MHLTKDKVAAIVLGAGQSSSDFDLNGHCPRVVPQKQAAVLVPIIETKAGPQVILTKRAEHLKHHPGQIAFPGGRWEECDETLWNTALREAKEEIGLPETNVSMVGELPHHDTVSSYRMTPFVGWVDGPWNVHLDANEVADMFYVPLDYVLNLENYALKSRQWQGVKRYYYAVNHGKYYIWGATARILRGMAEKCVLLK